MPFGHNVVESPHIDSLVADEDKAHIGDLQLFAAAPLRIGGKAFGVQGSALRPIGITGKFCCYCAGFTDFLGPFCHIVDLIVLHHIDPVGN